MSTGVTQRQRKGVAGEIRDHPGLRTTGIAGGAGNEADQILSTAVDGFTIGTPLAVALDGRDTMVAVGMNGERLPLEHGFPARLVTPGIYGFVGATKWLSRLTLTDTPTPLSTVAPGRTVIGGVAWAQTRGIGKVEVRIDGGAWREARLGPDAGADYWRQWYLPWDAPAGRHMLAVRATSDEGEVQRDASQVP